MKKGWLILALVLLLTGCSTAETYETLADQVVVSVLAEPKQIQFSLPEESVLPAMETENGTLYLCSGYDVSTQILPGGDLDGTVRSVSGCGREELTVLETAAGEYRRLDFVWTVNSDEGEQVCRAAILDDGSYHYVLSAMTDADTAREYGEMWNGMFESFTLS